MFLLDLPVEVQHQILLKLEGISLARAECVCKLWKDIVTTPLFNLVWRQICLNDIEESVLVELTGIEDILMCHLKYTVRSDNTQKTDLLIWKYVYKKWCTNKRAGHWPVVKSEMKANEGEVNHIDVSGDIICTAHTDKSIRLWDSCTRQCLQTFKGHHKAVVCVAFYHKPATTLDTDRIPYLLASGAMDTDIRLWNVLTGLSEAIFTQHNGPVNCLAVTNTYLISASYDGSILGWNLIQKILSLNIKRAHSNPILYLSVCKWEAVSVAQDKLKFWSLKTGECLYCVELDDKLHTQYTIGCTVRHGRALLVKNDGQLNLWDLNRCSCAEGKPIFRYRLLDFETTQGSRLTCVSTYANLLAVGTEAGVVFLFYYNRDWSEELSEIHSRVNTDHLGLCCMLLQHDGDGPVLVTGYNDGTIKIFRWFSPSIN